MALAISVIFTAAMPGARAQSEEALGLTLVKTSMRTQNDSVTLNPIVFQQAFQPTTGACPASATHGCTLRIEVSCIFENTDFSGSETINVTVSSKANLPAIDPAASVPVDGVAASSPNWDAHTFHWMQRNIPAGASLSVAVGVEGNGTALYRTETIELFTN